LLPNNAARKGNDEACVWPKRERVDRRPVDDGTLMGELLVLRSA
jgi:hypothetical protein